MSDKPKRNLMAGWGVNSQSPQEPTGIPNTDDLTKNSPAPGKSRVVSGGRPLSEYRTGKSIKMSSVFFYDENFQYCTERAKELHSYGIKTRNDYINWLIDQDATQNPETANRAKKIFDMQNS